MKKQDTIFPLKDKLVNDFEIYRSEITVNNNEELINIRKSAFENFLKSGLPTQALEEWRNTDLTDVYNETYNHYYKPPEKFEDIDKIFQCNVPHLKTKMLAMYNGWYVAKDDYINKFPNGLIYGSFAHAIKEFPELVNKYFAKIEEASENSFTNINTAMAIDGFFIYVPENVKVEIPIQLVNIIHHDKNIFIQTRNLIILEKNSKITLIHCDDSYNHQKSLINSVTEVYAAENSTIEHYKMQNLNNDSTLINTIYYSIDANTNLTTNGISLNGGKIKNNQYIYFNGTNCQANAYGLYLMDRKQHIDNMVYVKHNHPYCVSNELFKGILDDSATGAFNGHVYVGKDAYKTNAFQSNKNILLTDKAKANSKPFLEIYNDDVKCSHGSTVGQLDYEAMFYLRSRGISEHNAKMLLMYAFADEIIQKITIEPLKFRLEDMVKKRLRGELSVCDQCVLHCSQPEKEYNFEIDLAKI
jgi:Fe-S cluster assembly protein SufD